MNTLKSLTVKEWLMLSIPVIVGTFLHLIIVNIVYPLLITKMVKKDHTFSSIPEVNFTITKQKFSSVKLDKLIHVEPFKIKPAQEKTAAKEKLPKYKVSFIYIGKEKYAVINGILFKQGDFISKDEKLVKITPEGVLIRGKWGERWIKFSGF